MKSKALPIIGLLGGIGAGKTTVARILKAQGCVVADSDALAREALDEPKIRETLVRWWGEGILKEARGTEDGREARRVVDRKAVAAIVFADPEQLRRLEALTHPWVEQRRKEIFAEAPEGAAALVIDAPLILEAGLGAVCDALVFVEADRRTRLERVKATRGWDEGEMSRREIAQYPLDEKRKLADHVVVNTGDLDELESQVQAVLGKVIRTCGGTSCTG